MARDYYEVLGVERTIDAPGLKAAYRKLAMKYHPDRNQGDKAKEAEEQFKEAKEAYEMLSDPQKRAAYDQYGHAGVDPNMGAGRGGPGGEGFGGFADFAFARQEHQNIAFAVSRQFVRRIDNRVGQLHFCVVFVFAGQRAVEDFDGISTSTHFQHGRAVEVLGEAFCVYGG